MVMARLPLALIVLDWIWPTVIEGDESWGAGHLIGTVDLHACGFSDVVPIGTTFTVPQRPNLPVLDASHGCFLDAHFVCAVERRVESQFGEEVLDVIHHHVSHQQLPGQLKEWSYWRSLFGMMQLYEAPS